MIAEKYLSLNNFQMTYVNTKIEENFRKVRGLSPITINTDWPTLVQLEGDVPPPNPNFFQQQELMSEFAKWLNTQEGVNVGFSAGPAQSQAPQEKPAEEKVEEKKEKEIVDIELTSFDATKKINLIKEVRAITGLGLKESKEVVEKVPNVFKTNIKKDEAKEIKEKLEAIGAVVTLK